jgi:hypothetical protein
MAGAADDEPEALALDAPLADPVGEAGAEAGEAFEPHAVRASTDMTRTAVRRTGRPRFDGDNARHSNRVT